MMTRAFATVSPVASALSDEHPHCALSTTASLTMGLVAGDENAFRAFHENYYSRLLRYHLVLARGDEQHAREALQETFGRVARGAKRFDSEEAFWGWLAVVARSSAIDGGRRRQRYWSLLKNYATAWRAPEPPGDDALLHELLEKKLQSLAADDRALLAAKYFQGVPVRELARQTGQSEKAVEARLHRLRRQLRDQLLNSLRNERSR